METIVTVIGIFAGLFTFAFGMAWAMPLFAARTEQAQPASKSDWTFAGWDLILILLDCVPIFWLFRAVPEIPSTYTAARDKWRSESSIRGCFYAWLVSLTVTVVAIVIGGTP